MMFEMIIGIMKIVWSFVLKWICEVSLIVSRKVIMLMMIMVVIEKLNVNR